MNHETYNGDMIDRLAKLATSVMLARSSEEQLLGMVVRILAKPGELSDVDVDELNLINLEMFRRTSKEIEAMPRGNA